MTARDRAEDDIRRGDYALARDRLTSYLANVGYQASLLAHIGRIAHDMHDPCTAGRFWLLSDAEGEEVERCVDEFIRRNRGKAHQVCASLPTGACPSDLSRLPEQARRRLERFALEDTLAAHASHISVPGVRRSGWKERFVMAGCILSGLLAFRVFVTGAATILDWLLR